MPSPSITLYVDTVSPFAYIAFHILRNDATFRECTITYVPIFLGGLMKKCGNTAPLHITNKNKWIEDERRLWAQTFKVPMHEERPPNFPPLTLNIMRCMAVLDETDGRHDQKRLIQCLEALYKAFWLKQLETSTPEILYTVLEQTLGREEAKNIVNNASAQGKTTLAHNTDSAFNAGAFGLPWMVCTNPAGQVKSFWGVDHLGQVASFLGLTRPSTAAWKAAL